MSEANGNAAMVTTTPKARDLKSYLEQPGVRQRLAQAAGGALKPEDLIRLALMAASRNEQLLKCSQDSILRALLDAAALGIKPGGLMGRGYLVPRWNKYIRANECNFDPGWRGLVDIARRSGKIRRIEAHVVFDSDVFEYEMAPLTKLRHIPSEDEDPGEVRAAWAVAELSTGELQIEVMWRRDLEKVRKLGAENGPWKDWYDEMARKSVVRRLCKYLPYDPMLDEAVRLADAADPVDFDKKPALAAPSQPASLPARAPTPAEGTQAPASEPRPVAAEGLMAEQAASVEAPAADGVSEEDTAKAMEVLADIHAARDAKDADGLAACRARVKALPRSVQGPVREAYTAASKAIGAVLP